MLKQVSSAYKSNSHLTACGIYKRNTSGSKIDPWGLHIKVFLVPKKDLFKLTLNFLWDRYDLNQRMKFLENPKNSILLIRIL